MDSMNSQSITKPPFFNGDNYGYWKMRMENFIQSIDYDLWIVTTHVPFVPMTTVGEHQVPTPMDKLTSDDKKKLSLNAKALSVLFCALGQDEFARVSSCKSAKGAWKLLEATHEGDKDTKATKIALGTSDLYSHELLLRKMKEEEQVHIIKKTMALKIDDHPESEGESDEELAMFKRYKKFMKWKKGESSKRFPPKKGKSNQITCYECGNVGHVKPECPKLKKKEELKKGKNKKMQMLASWPQTMKKRFILLKILKENVIPVLNKDKQVGNYEYTLLYLLLTRKKINLPSIIIQHMYECSGRQNKPYGMLLTHIFAKQGILEVRPSRVRYLDTECLGYCGLIKIGEEYYMKKEFQKLDAATRAEYGPRRSMSSLPFTSQAPDAEANNTTEVPVRAPRIKRSKSASHASSASLLHRHSHMASTSKNPFKKFKKFILKSVVAPMRKLQESLDDLSDRMKKMEEREARRKQQEDRASRRG
ncbi:unnamed protein product [Cuscuta campestris]|uniref:CCHC-type domain-containing protein n=1 Tax=Cuscuta campestris TaxID=132261 RepID=A0A484LTQ9_9ASTE|nr:unnamed protein product [Cuscuta campestris]